MRFRALIPKMLIPATLLAAALFVPAGASGKVLNLSTDLVNYGIASNMLTRRLNALVEAGLLERRRYSEHPPRDEYVLTDRGRDFHPVLLALLAWGNRHFAVEGASVQLVNLRTGARVEPMVVDAATGEEIAGPDFAVVAGPAADEGVRHRLAERGRRPFVHGSEI